MIDLHLTYEDENGFEEKVFTCTEGEFLTLQQLFDGLSVQGSVQECCCYVKSIHSGGYWSRAQTDKMLNKLVQQFARETEDVSIDFRPKSSSGPSFVHATTLQNLDVENEIEPFTQKPISSLSRDDLVILPLDSKSQSVLLLRLVAVECEHLQLYIRSCLVEGVSIFQIAVEVELRGGSVGSVVLTKEVWTQCLIRGAHAGADDMLEMFAACFEIHSSYEKAVSEVHSSGTLWNKIWIFACDLLNMSSNEEAAARLESDLEAKFYLSRVYFCADEREQILAFPTHCGLLFGDMLTTLFEKKFESIKAGTSRGHICSSHDIAPVFIEVFRISRHFHQEKGFQKVYKAFEKDCKRQKSLGLQET